MARPRAKELTERELEVMQVFWSPKRPPAKSPSEAHLTVAEVRAELAAGGRELAYTTVATLIRILAEKGFLDQTNVERPFRYRVLRSFDEVSQNMLGDLLERVFGGSRELLLMRLIDRRRLTKRERELLESILRENP